MAVAGHTGRMELVFEILWKFGMGGLGIGYFEI